MAKNGYIGVDDVARKVGKMYIGVDGVARKITKSYIGDENGLARPWFVSGAPISTLAVGSIVFMNVNGVKTEFLVVHQGLPSSVYDSSCDGTWLLMKDVYESRAFDSYDQDYRNSDIHGYLNNTFANLFDINIKSVIKQVKIPYRPGTGNSPSVNSGSNGLSAKVFLLSYTELGFRDSTYAPVEGAFLDYFNDAANSDRIGYLNGSAVEWSIRTPYLTITGVGTVWRVTTSGTSGIGGVTSACGIRPALILPSDTMVNDDFNIVV